MGEGRQIQAEGATCAKTRTGASDAEGYDFSRGPGEGKERLQGASLLHSLTKSYLLFPVLTSL